MRLPRVGACSFKPKAVSLEQLGHTVFSLRNSAACGADGVSIRMLKTAFPSIGGIVLHIINTCITESDIPEQWKHSIVRPIFKSGNPSDPANFRPISLVPVIMKIVEKVIHQQLYHYLSYNHLLASTQHGFRPGIPLRQHYCLSRTTSSPLPIEGTYLSYASLISASVLTLSITSFSSQN